MTFDEYVEIMNDPRRTPMGVLGPLRFRAYTISAARRPASARSPVPRDLPDSPAEFRQQLALAARRAVPGSPEEFRQQLALAAARGRRAPQRPLVARPPLARAAPLAAGEIRCAHCHGIGFRVALGRFRCRGCDKILDLEGRALA